MPKTNVSRPRQILIITLGLTGMLFCLGLVCIGILINPVFRYCYLDFASGHAPEEARNQFIKKVLDAAANEDYTFLESVSQSDAVNEVRNNATVLKGEYTIQFSDDLAGSYFYRVYFANGTEVRISLYSSWPQCPDFNVTDAEILTYIQLDSFSVRSPQGEP